MNGHERLVIYGAGIKGRFALAELSGVHDVIAFVDSHPGLHDTCIGGVTVYPPEALPRLDFDRVVCATERPADVAAVLSGLGLSEPASLLPHYGAERYLARLRDCRGASELAARLAALGETEYAIGVAYLHLRNCKAPGCRRRYRRDILGLAAGVGAGPPAPAFLGIGMRKAGTTWLSTNLALHPDLYLPWWKECRFFESDLWDDRDLYMALFATAGTARLAGEITPVYATLSDERMAAIKTGFPALKGLLLLRDPVERAWSAYRMDHLRDGITPELEQARPALEREMLRLGDSLQALERWEQLLGRESVLTLFYDRIAAEPERLLAETFDFLGVPVPSDWSGYRLTTHINVGQSAEMPKAVEDWLAHACRPTLEALAQRFGGYPQGWLKRYFV